MGGQPPMRDHRIAFAEAILLHRLAKLSNMAANPRAIDAPTVKDQQTLDVLRRARAPPADSASTHRHQRTQCRYPA
jgi:hypothetical protein